MQGLAVGQPRGDVRGHRPQVILSDVLDGVAASGRLQECDAERGSPDRRVWSSDKKCSDRRSRAQGPPVDSPSAERDAVLACGTPTRRSNTPWSTTRPPANGMAT